MNIFEKILSVFFAIIFIEIALLLPWLTYDNYLTASAERSAKTAQYVELQHDIPRLCLQKCTGKVVTGFYATEGKLECVCEEMKK